MRDLLHSCLLGLIPLIKLMPQTFDDAAPKPVFCNKRSEYTAGVVMTL